jgi:hypothetical protein
MTSIITETIKKVLNRVQEFCIDNKEILQTIGPIICTKVFGLEHNEMEILNMTHHYILNSTEYQESLMY